VPAVGLFEDILLCHVGNSVVVESPPLVVEPILDKGKIVAALSIAIMDTDCLKVIRILV
jgi:hypothetical protein